MKETTFKIKYSDNNSKDDINSFPTLKEASTIYLKLFDSLKSRDYVVVDCDNNCHDIEISVFMEIGSTVTLIETVKLLKLNYSIELANSYQEQFSLPNGIINKMTRNYGTTVSKALYSLAIAVKREIAKRENE